MLMVGSKQGLDRFIRWIIVDNVTPVYGKFNNLLN